MYQRLAWLSIVVSGLLVAPLVGQQGTKGRDNGKQDHGKIVAAVETWLASEQNSQELLKSTVKTVLSDSKFGIGHVGKVLAGKFQKLLFMVIVARQRAWHS